MKLSVVMITRNEKRNLARALSSVRFADEIVVLDSGSDDGTQKLAEALGARVETRTFTGFAEMKNAAVDLALGEWIFVLDADEEVTPALAEAIIAAIHRPDGPDAYGVPRLSSFLGRWIHHSGWFPDYTVRLFRRGKAHFRPVRVHESLAVDGRVERFPRAACMNHYTYETMEQYLAKLNQYTSLAATDMIEKGRQPRIWDLFIHPPFTFFRQYILRAGWRDGSHGLVLALLSSFYVFIKYLKLRFPDRTVEE